MAVSASGAAFTRVDNTTLHFPATPPSTGYAIADAFPGLTFREPVAIVSPPGDSRVFVLEKLGRIQVITNVATPTKTLFLDLSGQTIQTREDGLLGLAFHPGFRTNGYFYVFYNVSATTALGSGLHDRLSRFSISPTNPNQGVLGSEVPLITQYDRYDTHNAGDLHFGPDGYLYVAFGDEGGADDMWKNSQKIDLNFYSSILRIDVDNRPGNLAPNPHPASAGNYSIPADNPFIGATSFNGLAVDPNKVRTEFFAVGFRNPWRMSFDRATGRLFVGDVGQDAREEIDVVTRGGNYGWIYRQGEIAYRGTPPAGTKFVDPILTYRRNGTTSDPTREGNSVTGGVVYRGSRMPELAGQYIFGDYSSGNIWAVQYDGTTTSNFRRLTTASGPVAFGLDPTNGDVLIAEISSGRIRRLVAGSGSSTGALPATLADTGAFSDLTTLTPNPGIVPYEINVPFWSDYAKKTRWFSIPNSQLKMTFDAANNWTFPSGAVWIKHFDLEMTAGDPTSAKRIETRFLVKTDGGIYGLTYRWDSEANATLVAAEGASDTFMVRDGSTTRTQVWKYPARSQCLMCHSQVGGWAVGFGTAQLNRYHDYGGVSDNQIRALSDAGYFTAPVSNADALPKLAAPDDESASLEYRARSYLAANCVQCHQPGGAGQGFWDARISTPMANAGIIDGQLVDYKGDANNRVIKLGSLGNSMILTRISNAGSMRMPPLGSTELDPGARALISRWITNSPPPPDAPSITAQPQSRTVTAGSTVTFSVTATGSGTLQYQWRKEGLNIWGATASSLTLTDVQSSYSGNYTVVVSNAGGSTTSAAALLTVNTPPSISTQPQSRTVNAGSTVTFSVTASGTSPLGYQWRKDVVNIAGATSSSLTLANVQPSQAGSYTVVVSNVAGSATSAAAALTVNTPPSITTQPQSQTVTAGANVTFTVAASGTAPLQYQWRKDGVNISGATASALTLANVQSADGGNYSVLVSNAAGSTTSAGAVLTVNAASSPPTITSQPQDRTVSVGATATFSVTATGSAPLQYQWRKEAADLAGETSSSLTLANVQSSDGGNYTVVVSNSSGSATSVVAVLTVNEPTTTAGGPLIIDHDSVAKYALIPQQYIDEVKKMWLNMPGGARGRAYGFGGRLLQELDARFAFSYVDGTTPEPYTTEHLRYSQIHYGDLTTTNRWRNSYKADAWFISDLAIATTTRHLAYCNTTDMQIAAIGLAWAGETLASLAGGVDPVYNTRWGGSSVNGPDGNRCWGLNADDYPLTLNRICMDTYLNATQGYADFCKTNGFPTKVLFTTDSVEDYGSTRESGYQRHLKAEHVRNYVRASSEAILFDYADILCWSDAGELSLTTWTGNGTPRTFPFIHPDNMLDLDGTYIEDGDRIGQRGALRLAKAVWVMLAQFAGWTPPSTAAMQALNAPALAIRPPEIVDGNFTLAFPTQEGVTYRLEYKKSLDERKWIPLGSAIGTGTSLRISDTENSSDARFYRIHSD